MYNKTFFIKTALIGGLAITLAACSNPKDANKSNFSKAIQAYLDTQPGLCAAVPAKDIPFTLNSDSFGYKGNVAKADALVDAGLLSKQEVKVKAMFGNRQIDGIKYDITAKGEKFRVANAADTLANQDAFCAGKYTVAEVDNFSEPSQVMGMTVSQVKFHYQVKSPASWATNDKVRNAFKNFDAAADGDIAAKAALLLTNDGWVHERLFR